MISRNQVKWVTSLHNKKYRREEGLFIAEGEKIIRELLKSDLDVVSLFGTQSFFQRLGNDIRISKTTDVVLVEDIELKKISALTTPQSVVAVIRIPPDPEINFESGPKLVLDGISDPGNLGTIIRTADWFGIREVVCSNESVDCYNPKVVQGTMGSLFRIKLIYEDLTEILDKNLALAALPVYGLVLDGDSIYHENFPESAWFVLGSEANGIDPKVEKYLTKRITIPPHQSSAESLNAAIAAAIICSEIRR